MKRLIIFLFLGMNICLNVIAGPACPKPFQVIQSNGDTIWVSLHGDEYGSWYEDSKGNVIDRNNTRDWVYVNIEKGRRVLTDQIVTKISSPIKVCRDSVFEYIVQKRKESYIKRKYNGQKRSKEIDSKLIPLPSEGENNILTILVQFPDVKFQNQNQTELVKEIDSMMNQRGYKHHGQSSETGSLCDYFMKVSNNKLKITSTVIGPYTAPYSIAHYGADSDSTTDVNVLQLVVSAINYAMNKVDASLFDNNNDGWIECIHILYAGKGQDLDTALKNLIWPHEWTLNGYLPMDTLRNVKASRYIITPELGGNYYRGVGTLCHELGHVLGIPDFYDVKKNNNNDSAFCGTGNCTAHKTKGTVLG